MKPALTLKAAKVISEAAEAEAKKNGLSVAIAITDERGELIYFVRMDKTTSAAVSIAQKKAFHASYYHRDTVFHENVLAQGNENMAVLSMPYNMPIEGGLLLGYNGEVIGAIGVSGAMSNEDGQIAEKGREAFKKLIKE